jgi:hypothetical protein
VVLYAGVIVDAARVTNIVIVHTLDSLMTFWTYERWQPTFMLIARLLIPLAQSLRILVLSFIGF